MDMLILPEPAQGLWRLTAEEVHRLLEYLPDDPGKYTIGGGTILAARWGHRRSTDIDLTVPEGSGLSIATEEHAAEIRERMIGLGSEEPMLTGRHYRMDFPAGRIEITELNPRPAAGSETCSCDGYTVEALSATQVLRGKLERTLMEEIPARDLFDVVVASQIDVSSLHGAVNMLTPDDQRTVMATWGNAEYRVRQEAPERIQVLREEFRRLIPDLTKHAIRAFEDARYVSTAIRRNGTEVVLTARAARQSSTFRSHIDDIEDTLERTGMNEYFRHTAPGPTAIRRRIDDAMAHPENGPKTLTTTAAPEPERPTPERAPSANTRDRGPFSR